MKKCIFCVYFIVFVAIVSGCSKEYSKNTPQPMKVVTGVNVTQHKGEEIYQWQYTSEDKMEAILLYLRLLPRGGRAEVDPDRVAGDNYEITLQYSNGEKRMYYQHADQYLSVDYQPWEKIDPKDGRKLQRLLTLMPSDDEQ